MILPKKFSWKTYITYNLQADSKNNYLSCYSDPKNGTWISA